MRRILQATTAAIALSATPAVATDVGVAWIGSSGTADALMEAIEARLAEAGPEITLTVQGELPDAQALAETVAGFEADMDGMLILRSTGYTFLADHPPSLPTFIAGGNHPVELGVVDSLESPGGNVTGSSLYVEPQVMLEIFVAVDPTQSSLLVLGDANHPATQLDAATVPAACDVLFLICEVVGVSTPEEATALIDARSGEFSGIVLNATAILRRATDEIVTSAEDLPVFGYFPAHANGGALAAAGPNLQFLGAATADQMIRVLVDGAAVGDQPIVFDGNPLIYVNQATRDRLGVSVPAQISEIAVIVGE